MKLEGGSTRPRTLQIFSKGAIPKPQTFSAGSFNPLYVLGLHSYLRSPDPFCLSILLTDRKCDKFLRATSSDENDTEDLLSYFAIFIRRASTAMFKGG